MVRFFFYDSTLYRDVDDTLPNEIWRDGRWTAIVRSEQDYDHMREVTAAEATRLIAGQLT